MANAQKDPNRIRLEALAQVVADARNSAAIRGAALREYDIAQGNEPFDDSYYADEIEVAEQAAQLVYETDYDIVLIDQDGNVEDPNDFPAVGE